MALYVTAALSVLIAISLAMHAHAGAIDDPSLVMHYTFDQNPRESVKDSSSHGNDGTVSNVKYLADLDGRKGVVRFAGASSYIDCGNAESLQFAGDMSFEMWVRLNDEVKSDWGFVFGDYPPRSFYFTYAHHHTLMFWYHTGEEPMLVPVDRNLITTDEWSHIAVVVEYPRLRIYRNGWLVRDAYMPVPGLAKLQPVHKFIGGGGPDGTADASPIDLDEIRFYRRALSAPEVAAHAKDQEVPPQTSEELAVEPNWYDRTVTLRLTGKGMDYRNASARLTLLRGDRTELFPPQGAEMKEAFENSGRYVVEAKFPLDDLENLSVDAVARIAGDGNTVREVVRHAYLAKPDWINNREGYSEGVPAPWTPIEAETKPDGTVEARVWDRRYIFGSTPFMQQIDTGGKSLLASPIQLHGSIDGKQLAIESGKSTLKSATPTTAVVEQVFGEPRADVRINSAIEYDGFIKIDCTLQARRDLNIEQLLLEIPMQTQYATLCYGNRVLPEDPKALINAWYSGAVRGDLSFRFTHDVWLGNDERGLSWAAESDEHWRYADKQKAIEILPRGETTTFVARLVDVPTKLAAGKSMQFTFALQATPIKPRLRDAWDLRIVRSDPYGNDLDLPDRMTDGKSTLQYYADAGVRHLFINANDIFPWPMPVNPYITQLIHRLSDATHAHGLKLYQYVIHERVPVHVPEFDLYGLNMANRPMSQFTPGGYPMSWTGQSGPVAMRWGADSQGCVMFCAQSKALQDAYLHSLAQRVDTFGEDGVYLDGTGDVVPCSNIAHGCGYRADDGTIHQTYPVFANREFLKRIYTLVKKRRPDGVVDLHCSGLYFPPVLAYADIIWTGEQWYHQANQDLSKKYVAQSLTLDGFRTEFTGYQIGVGAETLAYRLGPPMKVAATSLLHDIPIRPRTQDTADFETFSKLWKLRDAFGAKEAEKLFYWNNQDYVQVSPAKCYATLFKHPRNGVLAVISNLSPDAQKVSIHLSMEKLGLAGRPLDSFDALSKKPVSLSSSGEFSIDLASEEWTYVWIHPKQ